MRTNRDGSCPTRNKDSKTIEYCQERTKTANSSYHSILEPVERLLEVAYDS
jgi:hypothetical protein